MLKIESHEQASLFALTDAEAGVVSGGAPDGLFPGTSPFEPPPFIVGFTPSPDGTWVPDGTIDRYAIGL